MTEPDWIRHAIWWQVYPLGFVGAFPADEPPTPAEHRLTRIVDWLDHAVGLGVSGAAPTSLAGASLVPAAGAADAPQAALLCLQGDGAQLAFLRLG